MVESFLPNVNINVFFSLIPQWASCINSWILTCCCGKKHRNAHSLLTWNITCHLHMLILAAPRDPLTCRKSLKEWKGQAHSHSRMSSWFSHISGMNADVYWQACFIPKCSCELAHGCSEAWHTPTLGWNFASSTCSSSWSGSLPLSNQLSGLSGVCERGGKEYQDLLWLSGFWENCYRNLALWSAHCYHPHQSKWPHPSSLVSEQLFGLLVWSYQPSMSDRLPNPRKLGV